MGALYIDEDYDEEDNYETEDKNNNYLDDPEAIDLEKHAIHLDHMGMKKEDDHVRWNELIKEVDKRYVQTKEQNKPETEKITIKQENGEEQAAMIREFHVGTFAATPGAENHVTAETAGTPSILRTLLERDSRCNDHAKMKDALDLKEEEIKNTKEKKWKNKMTVIHSQEWKNKKTTNKEEDSLSETVSMRSGTDSQYDKLSPESLHRERQEEDLPSDAITIDTSQSLYIDEDSPNQRLEGSRDQQLEDIQEKQSDQLRENNFQTRQLEDLPETRRCLKELIEMQKQLEDDDVTNREDEISRKNNRRSRITCKIKKKKINNIQKQRRKSKMKKELTIYYRKMKSKLQGCRIYILKKHLNLMRAVMEIKNNEIAVQTLKDSLANEKSIPRSSYDGLDGAAMMVQTSDQSDRAADGGGVTHDLRTDIIRDCTTSVRANKETADATREIGCEKRKSKRIARMQPIQDEEERLRAEYRKLIKIRDADARKRTRIEKWKKLIAQLPKLPVPELDERELRAVKELEEVEMQHNYRYDTSKIVNLIAEAKNKQGNPCVEIDTMASLTYNPIHINPREETIMIMLLIKGDEASIRADVVGDIDVNLINYVTTTVPRQYANKNKEAERIAKAQSLDTIRPDTEGESPDIIRQLDEAARVEAREEPSTSREKTTRDSRKRDISYVEESSSEDESREISREDDSSSGEEMEKRKLKVTSTKKSSAKKKKPTKTVAKDGRKLADVTNRLRDEKGRLMGYKPGAQKPTQKCKNRTTRESKEEDETPERETRVRMKMPSKIPALATHKLKVEIQRLAAIASSETAPATNQPLNSLQKAEIDRARSMRPQVRGQQQPDLTQTLTDSQPDDQQSQEVIPDSRPVDQISQTEEASQGAIPEGEDDDEVPLTQPIQPLEPDETSKEVQQPTTAEDMDLEK